MRRGILATIDELSSLRGRLGRKPFDAIYQALLERCSLILESSPVTEQQWQQMWQKGSWGSAMQAARSAQGRLFDLLIAHNIDRNTAYRDRAIEELRNLTSWSTWVDPCHNHIEADLCTAEAAVAATVALDWLWDDLTEANRRAFSAAIIEKAIKPYLEGVKENAFWYECYHNWNAVVNGGVALAALAFADECPEAKKAYKAARKGLGHFFDALGREGGWDEGTGYWGYAMRYVLLLGEAASRLDDDQKIFHHRGMSDTGAFGAYFTPNGFAASFGDNPTVPLHGAFYILTKYFSAPELTWWLDTYSFHRDVSTSGYSAAGLALLFRSEDMDTPGKLNMPQVKVFNQIGWAAMADNWPRPAFYVAAKTGDLSANHSQRDMNSIQLQVDGEMLLVEPGNAPFSREYLSESRGDFYEVQTRAHNTIAVAESGHLIDAQGTIDEAVIEDGYCWVVCNAGRACGEMASFNRHLVMLVDPNSRAAPEGQAHTLVVLDELNLASPEKIELFWHAGGAIDLDVAKSAGTITGRRASLNFAVAATIGLELTAASHKLSSRESDNVLVATGGAIGRAFVVSVFSRDNLAGKVSLEETEGDIVVQAGPATLEFRSARKHLKLAKVTS